MNDHHRLTNLTTELARIATAIETNGHDLIRRARIPTGPDGYPHRASGAQPGDGTTSTRHDTNILVNLDHTWTWTCSCDTTGDTYPNEYLAVRAAEDHANGHSTLDYADPTGDAAVAPTEPDPVRTSARRLLRHLEKAHLELTTALGIIHHPHIPDPGDPGCESCARLTGLNGLPVWEPPDPRRKAKTTVGGRLTTSMFLCRWCADQVGLNHDGGRTNPLPTRDELTTHHTGRNLRRPA